MQILTLDVGCTNLWVFSNVYSTNNIELIYFDEFKLVTRKNSHYGWSPQGEKGYVRLFEDDLDVSVVIGFSMKAFYGLLCSSSSITSETIVYFLKRLYVARANKFKNYGKDSVLIWDNASIHKSHIVKNFLSKSRLRMITNCPYQPCLNPCEQLINAVKSKIRKYQAEGR